MKNKAVVLGANYYISLSIIRCLGIHDIYVTAIDYDEKNAYAFKSKYLSEKIIGPHYKKEEKELLELLIEYSKKQDVKPVLYPSADQYVEFIDNNFDVLKNYYLFPQTKKGLFTEVMNKKTLSVLANKMNVKTPETIYLSEKNYIEKVTFPCLIKPVDSVVFVAKFRKKNFKANNRDELNEYIKMAQKENIEVIIQRIIPGFDDHMYTFDAYLNKNSKITHWLTCQKYRQYPINFGASVYTTQKYVPELYDISKKFLENIEWKGFAEIEFKKDANSNEYYLIEVNVRTTNFNVLLLKCGFNFPYIQYLEMVNKEIGEKYLNENTNLVFWYSYEDYFAIKEYIRTKQLTRWQIFISLFKFKAYAIWSFDDPMPYFSFFNMKIIRKIKRKLFKKTKLNN